MQTRYSVRWHNSKANRLTGMVAVLLGVLLLGGCKLPMPKATHSHPVANSVPSSPTAPPRNSSSGASSTGINVNPAADPYRGVLAACPQGAPAKTQADWYMPGYQHIGQRLCDGQWVTCGNSYPCAAPTPKDGSAVTTEYGYDAGSGQETGAESSYYHYYAPKH